MEIDLHRYLRRALVCAGAPLLPLGCSERATTQTTAEVVAPPPSVASSAAVEGATCTGGWGRDSSEGGCKSGPYTATHSKFIAIKADDRRSLELYASCSRLFVCPRELCERVLDYKPRSSDLSDEHFGSVLSCAPACAEGARPGIHILYTVAGDCMGRRPEGFAREDIVATDDLSAFFVAAAGMEGAAVFAFERLARELLVHGAPDHLVAAALASMMDEARHHALMRRLARRAGADAALPRVEPLPARSLVEVALENAAEGLVGEMFGSAVAGYQAAASPSRAVRGAMRTIAVEEAGHAALALMIDRWVGPKLSRSERARVREAVAARADALSASVEGSRVSPALVAAGVPTVDAQMTIVQSLTREVWTPSSLAAA